MLREAWESYETNVLPKNAGDVQRGECRHAFYAGAAAVLFGIIGTLSPSSEPTMADVEALERLREELRTYVKQFG